MRKTCFTPVECSIHCPNTAMDAYDARYGAGLAEDLGYEKTKCGECRYNTGRCTDCLFENTEICRKAP